MAHFIMEVKMYYQPDLFVDNDPETVVKEILRSTYQCDGEDEAYAEIYPDRNDYFDDYNLSKICVPGKVQENFWEWVDELYLDAENDIFDEAIALCRKDSRLAGVSDEDLRALVHLTMYVTFPEEHWLRQLVPVDIMIDTGDANFDFACNKPVDNDNFPQESSLLWLAKQQGYKKSELKHALTHTTESKLLNSIVDEVNELPSDLGVLTFLVRMPMEKLIELDNAINLEKGLDQFYNLKDRKGRGHITLAQNTPCGLYNAWTGGGSLLNIALEKDVRIPIRCIHKAVYDGNVQRWSIRETYGTDDSWWMEDSLKEIVDHRQAYNTKKKEDKK